VAQTSSPPYLFGDLLALARHSWVRQMAERLDRLGYADYRRSDAMALRMLSRGPVSVGRLGAELGVTRQAARKVIDGLEQRDYVRTERDAHDSRVLNVILTPAGAAYARAVIEVIYALNREFSERADPGQLAAADAVLRAVIAGDAALQATAALIRPPAQT
jgi:DNA-binding MarR family transcriptional regulator